MHQKIAELIAAYSGLSPGTPISVDTDLFQAGMESFAAVQLMMAIEEAFAVQFPDAMMNRATFRTPGAIAAAVARLAPGATAA